MHTRRFASLLLGGWLFASALLDFVVIQNFRSVDRFLASPGVVAALQVKAIGGRDEARLFLRRNAAEENRYLFEQWEIAQLAIGATLIGAVVFGRGEITKLVMTLLTGMLAIVCVQRFALTPQIAELGRTLDNTGGSTSNDTLFWRLHGLYSGLELLKIGMGLLTACALLVRSVDRTHFVRAHRKSVNRAAQPQVTGSK